MANLTITASGVAKVGGATTEAGTAGTGMTLTAGETVYKKTTDSKFYEADCDTTAVAANSEIDDVYGITLNGASAGQPVDVVTSGLIDFGTAILTVGTVYCQSTTAGAICPWADLAATNYVVILGVATTTKILKLGIITTGVQIA